LACLAWIHSLAGGNDDGLGAGVALPSKKPALILTYTEMKMVQAQLL
jgi:hypothetical protein